MADRSEMPLLRKKLREVVRQVSGARTRENTLSLKLLTIVDCYLSVSLSVSLSRSPSRPVSLTLSLSLSHTSVFSKPLAQVQNATLKETPTAHCVCVCRS